MSEVIDSRVVEMRFDNSQFESNVRESMKTIDNLKSSLNFEDSVKGLDKLKVDIDASGAVRGLNEISEAASECDLSALTESTESVKLSFSALEIFAVTALGKIASAAIDAGAKAVNAFAIQPITDGFAEYNQQLKSTRVIVSNTGQQLSEVTAVLDDLNEYADKTIYSFGDMTQAMGYFTSALGENSAEAAAMIAKGVSNWAASTGQGNEVAKRVMYQISQALSTGSFRLMDWKSIENTGAMAGSIYQKYFLETASEIYNKPIENLLVNKKGEAVSFRESLQTGWLTNEVFLETMAKFANIDGSGAFQWMEDAATKVLTFSDLLDTVREQLGTGWGDTWKIVFGNYEQSISFFTGISDRIGNFITKMNNARNAIFGKWAEKGGRNLLFGVSEEDVGAVGKALDGVLEILSQIQGAFIDVFGTEFLADLLYGATEYVSKFAGAFEKFSRLPIIHDILRSVLSVIKSIFKIVSDLYKIIEPFLSLALDGIGHILTGASKVLDVVANIIDKISDKFSSLSDKITAPFKFASEFIAGTFGSALDIVSDKASSVWDFLKQFDIFGIMGGSIEDKITPGITTAYDKISETFSKSAEKTEKNIKSVTERLADLGISINSEEDLKGNGWQKIFWNAINETKKQQHYAVELWDDLLKNDPNDTKKEWIDAAVNNGYFDPGVYEELEDIWKQWAGVGEYENLILDETADSLEKVNKKAEDQVDVVTDGLSTVNEGLEEADKKSKEVTGTWWDLISDTEKQRYFAAQYWDDLTEEQKEGWKQYALGLGLFTEEELKQLEGTEKSIDDLLTDRDRLANKKRAEADAWWDLIDEDKKKQYFAGQFWDDLTDEQREAWRKRAEEYNLYDPEEYARLLSEMAAAEEAAFSPQSTQEIAESTGKIETWFDKASKIPVIGGFLEKFGWLATKTVKNAKSFGSAISTSFGGFFEFVKLLNGTDLTFFQKFNLASTYFKDHIVDYLGELVAKNFKSLGNVVANSNFVSKITSFTSSVKDRFTDFKNYVKDINANAQLTFHEKFKSVLDYFNTNILGYYGKQIGDKFKEIASSIGNNKIVTNLNSLGSAIKTKFGEFRSYISELNANTELTFPEKLRKTLEFLKTNVIDYFLELINKNLKSVGVDIEKIGKEISDALSNAANFILQTLNKLGINTEAIRKFFWNDDGTLKSIPDIIASLGEEIEQALNEVKHKLRTIYESVFPSTENGELTGPLGWLIDLKSKVDEFISSIFGTKDELEKAEGKESKGGLLTAALGVLGLTGGSSIMKTVGNMNSLFSFGKNLGISGSFNFGKIAIGVALAAGAFALLSKIDFTKLGIDFSSFTNYFKDSEGNLLSFSDIFAKFGDSLSNSKVGPWITNTIKLIGKNAGSAFNLFKDKASQFKEFLKIVNGSDLTFPQKFSLAATFFKDHFVTPFGELAKKNLKTIGIDIDGFINKFKGSEGEWLSVGGILEKIGNKISGSIEQIKTKLENTKVFQWISGKFEEFKSKNPEIVQWFDSFGDTVSKVGNWIGDTAKKVGNWVGDTAKLLGRNASTLFTVYGEKIENFKGHLKSLNDNTELTFPEKFKAALEYFKYDFIVPFEILAKHNLKTIGIDIDAFVNFFKDNEGNWLSVGKIITKIGDKIHTAFEDLKTKFEQSKFGVWISDKLEWIKSKFSSSSEWLGNFSNNVTRYIVPLIGGAGIALALSRIGQLFDFIQSIGQFFSGRTPVERANAFATRAEALSVAIRSVAAAAILISVALAGLSMLDQDNLTKASESLSRIIYALTTFGGILGLMIRINSGARDEAKKSASLILEISGSIFLIVAAFRILTTIPISRDKIGQLAASFGMLAGLMVMVGLFARFSPQLEGSKSSFLGIVGIATAVLEMVGALYLIQLMLESHRGVGWALITLFGLVGTFALLCRAARGVNWRAGLGLVLMANSVRTMIGALERVMDSDLVKKFNENRAENLQKIIAVFGSLAALALINRFAGGGRAGMNLLGVAASVWVLVQAMEAIADIPTDKMDGALTVVSILTIVMGGIMVAYAALNKGNQTSFRSMITTTVQLYSVVIGVLLLCAAVALLSTIDQTNMLTAFAVVGGLTVIVGAIAILLGVVSKNAKFGTALGLLGMVTIAAGLMGGLIFALDHFIPDKSNLMTIAESVAMLTGLIGLIAIAFGTIDLHFGSGRFLGQLAVTLLEIAVVVAAMGTVLTLIARNIPQNMDSGLLWSIMGAVAILTGVVSGLTIAFGKIKLNQIDFVNVGLSLLGMVAVLGVVSLIFTLMAERFPKDMPIDTLWSIVRAVAVLSAVVAVMAGVFGTFVKVDFASALQAALSMAVFGIVIEALMGVASALYEVQGQNIEKVVSLIGRICEGLVKIFDSVVSTLGKLNWWQFVGAIVVVAGGIAAAAAAGMPIALGLAAIIGIVGLVGEALITIAALIYSWQGNNIEKLVTLMGRVGRGFAEIFDVLMTSISKLSWWQLVGAIVLFGGAIGTLAFLAPQIGLNMGIFAVEMAVAAALTVGILDLTLPLFSRFANNGIPIFEKIASGIVSIASIIMDGIVTNVEKIIQCLRDFTNFAVNDFDAVKVGEAIAIAGQLTEVIGAFVGEGFLDMLGKFIGEKLFGETNRTAFEANVGCLTHVLNDFKTNVSSWTPIEYAKTKIAADLAQQLTDVCGYFTEDNLLSAYSRFLQETWFGYEYRAAFTANMKTIGEALRTFCTEIDSIPSMDMAKATNAIPIAGKMIELVKKFAPENVGEAFWQWFSSLSFNSETFKKNIENLSDAVKTFCEYVEKWTVPTDYESKFEVVDALIDFVDKMPALDNGLMGLDTFGDTVKTFSESFLSATYYLNSALSKAQITDYDSKMELMDDLIELTNKLPRVTGSMYKFIGYNIPQTLGDFGNDIDVFGTHLKAFATAMNNVSPITDWDTKKTIIGNLIELANLLPKDSSSWEKEVGYGFQMDFAKFGEDVESFAISFNGIVAAIDALTITDSTFTKFAQMEVLVERLAALAKQLPQSFSQADASGNSSMITTTFTQSFSEFMESILGKRDGGLFGDGSYKNTLFDQVNQIYDEIDGLKNFDDNGRRDKLEGLISEDGILTKLSEFTKELPEIAKDNKNLSNFGVEIYELATHIADAAEALSTNNSGSEYKFDPKPLEDLGKGIDGIISAFDGVDTEKLGHISSITGSLSGILSGNGNGSGLGDIFSSLVNSLLGDPFKGIEEAETNSSGIGNILGNLSGFGDLLGNITPEGGFDLASITQLFGTQAADGSVTGGFLSLIPASLTQFTTDMPKDAEITGATDILSTMFSGFSPESFGFDNLSPLLGAFTEGEGFDGTGFLQMMPEEIQTYITTMTSGEDMNVSGANEMITDLVSGVKEAGSITPDLATNFNTTLSSFATDGISSYANVFTSAETETTLNDAGKTIVEKTGKGIETALKSTPNNLETASKSAVKFISDILSGDSSNPYNVPGPFILDKTGNGITAALSASSSVLKNSVKSVVSFIVNILSGNESDNPYKTPGVFIISKTADGITSALNNSSGLLENAVRPVVSLVANILSGNSENPNPYIAAGESVIAGFTAGMSNTDDTKKAAYDVGSSALDGLKESTDSNSPSKEAMKYGKYFGEGFEIGINSYSRAIETTSGNIGNEALLGLTSYVSKVYDLLDSNMEFNPTITPVLDLSEIQNGMGLVDAMMSRQQAYSTNVEVNGAVRARNEALRAVSTTDNSRNFGGFTFNIYTQGTDANAIARQIGVEVSRKLRSTGGI